MGIIDPSQNYLGYEADMKREKNHTFSRWRADFEKSRNKASILANCSLKCFALCLFPYTPFIEILSVTSIE